MTTAPTEIPVARVRPALYLQPAPDSRPRPHPASGSGPGTAQTAQTEQTALQPPLPFGPAALRTGAVLDVPVLDVPVLDAGSWAATLAVAVFEALHGRRPVGQLTRWVDDRVHSAITYHRRRIGPATSGRPAVLRSIRVQHPRPDAAEVCAHLALAGRSHALALRLEVWGDRWLCTAVEFG